MENTEGELEAAFGFHASLYNSSVSSVPSVVVFLFADADRIGQEYAAPGFCAAPGTYWGRSIRR